MIRIAIYLVVRLSSWTFWLLTEVTSNQESVRYNIVDRGRWLGKPANFKYIEQRTHLEVEQGLTVHKVF